MFSTEYWIGREGIVTASYRDYYLEVYHNGQLIATSSIVRITTPSAAKVVTFDLQTESGNIDSGFKVHFWSYPQYWHPTKVAGHGQSMPLRLNELEVLNARPDILASRVERFIKWSPIGQSVRYRNHDGFDIISTTDEIAANYLSFITNAAVQANLIDDPGFQTTIQFKDPWLVDNADPAFYDSPYGYRNLGTSAIFKPELSPLQPNLTNKYKGVFLGQDPQQGSPLYYSLRVPLTYNGLSYNVSSWQYDPVKVDLLTESAPSGYEQKAVVFKQAGASITAKLKAYQASSYQDATGYNNQRKLVAHTLNAVTTHHLVYESSGDIWYASLTEGGSWTPEVLVSDGSGNNRDPSRPLTCSEHIVTL
jgi:hypothetical protein